MSLRTLLRLSDGARHIVSPYADGAALERFTYESLWPDTAIIPVTRAEAMRVPAVARARSLVATTIARADLIVSRDGRDLEPQPIWTYRTDTAQPKAHRIAWTVDDLIFYGESLWLVERDSERHVIRCEHVPFADWDVNADGFIEVDGTVPPSSEVVHIPGLHEGILAYGSDAIRGASAVLDASVETARRPFRVELHDTGDYPMSRAEVRTLIADTRAAMLDNAGVLYTSPGIEAKLHGFSADSLLVDGRESYAVDIARDVGIPSAMIDAYAKGATMTYQTLEQTVQSFLHLGLVTYMVPITARLSLDDVTPNGQTVRFDIDDILAVSNIANPNTPAPERPAT